MTEPETRVQTMLTWVARHLVVIVVVSLITLGVQMLLPQGRPKSPISVPSPPPGRSLYLAPIGDFPVADAETLVAHFQEKVRHQHWAAPGDAHPGRGVRRSAQSAHR